MLTSEGGAQQQQGQVRVGKIVERDIDGIWFPAKVVAVHETANGTEPSARSSSASFSPSSVGRRRQLSYDLVYLDDHNRESEVPEEEIRIVYDYGTKTKDGMLLLLPEKQAGDVDSAEARAHRDRGCLSNGLQTQQQASNGDEETNQGEEEGNEKSAYDHDHAQEHYDNHGHEGPKVTIHSSHGSFDTKEDGSATAYIINGPETNVAAGSGLRGIRWLRGP